MLETSVTRWLTYRVIVTNPVNQQYSFKGGSVFTLLFSLALLVCNNGTDWYWLLSVGGPLLVVMLVLIWLVLDVLYIYIYIYVMSITRATYTKYKDKFNPLEKENHFSFCHSILGPQVWSHDIIYKNGRNDTCSCKTSNNGAANQKRQSEECFRNYKIKLIW